MKKLTLRDHHKKIYNATKKRPLRDLRKGRFWHCTFSGRGERKGSLTRSLCRVGRCLGVWKIGAASAYKAKTPFCAYPTMAHRSDRAHGRESRQPARSIDAAAHTQHSTGTVTMHKSAKILELIITVIDGLFCLNQQPMPRSSTTLPKGGEKRPTL